MRIYGIAGAGSEVVMYYNKDTFAITGKSVALERE